MGILDTFRFNKKAYITKVTKSDSNVLHKKHHAKTRKRYTCLMKVTYGIIFAIPTMGISVIGSAYYARQMHILHQQERLIGEEIASRENEIPRHRKRDIAVGLFLGSHSSHLAELAPSN